MNKVFRIVLEGMNNWYEQYPEFYEYRLLQECGDKDTMAEAKIDRINKEQTKGFVILYDPYTQTISHNVIYKNFKGFYIKKNGIRLAYNI